MSIVSCLIAKVAKVLHIFLVSSDLRRLLFSYTREVRACISIYPATGQGSQCATVFNFLHTEKWHSKKNQRSEVNTSYTACMHVSNAGKDH